MSEELNTTTTEAQVETTDTQTEETENITMTKAELDALLQKNGDKRVTDALKKQEKKNADRVREAEKLAKMSEAEKYEFQLEQREKAIEEKERALALAENKNEASKILADKGLSLALVDFILAEDAETMNENIKVLEKAFKQSVKAEVEKRLGSKTPTQSLPLDKTITKQDFIKMNPVELQRLKAEQPELWKEFTK